LSWAWYALAQHRAIEVRLLTELKRVLQSRSPTVDDLSRLPYTEMIIKESLRLYPPAYVIGRQALQACTIGGYTIPAGATLFICPWDCIAIPATLKSRRSLGRNDGQLSLKHAYPGMFIFPLAVVLGSALAIGLR
jgi:hypothetical protein